MTRTVRSRIEILIYTTAALTLTPQSSHATPVVEDANWQLQRTIPFNSPQSARFNPVDGRLYVGCRVGSAPSNLDGLYVIDVDDLVTKLADGDRIATLLVNPANGDVFVSEDFSGRIYRTAFGATGRTLWVSGFHSGDDDPVGMAMVTTSCCDTAPGEIWVTDRGFGGPVEVWRFSADAPGGETVVHSDDGQLVDAVDLTIGSFGVFLADRNGEAPGIGRLFRVHPDGSLTLLPTSEPLNPTGLTTDDIDNQLIVFDRDGNRVVTVDPTTGNVANLFTNFAFTTSTVDSPWAGVDMSSDGTEIVVTDRGDNTLYVFSFVPPPPPPPPPPPDDDDVDSDSTGDQGDEADGHADSDDNDDADADDSDDADADDSGDDDSGDDDSEDSDDDHQNDSGD